MDNSALAIDWSICNSSSIGSSSSSSSSSSSCCCCCCYWCYCCYCCCCCCCCCCSLDFSMVTTTRMRCFHRTRLLTVASPEFVARRGKDGNYAMGHSQWICRAGCSSCSMTNSFVTNAVLIERAVSCWHLISQTTRHLDSWQSDLL